EVRALIAHGQQVGVLTHAEIRGTASQLDLDDGDAEELHAVIERLAIELVEEIDPATTAGNEVQRAPDRRARRAPSARPNTESDMPTDSLGVFLKQIGRVRLLTAPEEITLAKSIERGDLRAKQRMVECNVRLVVSRQELSPQRPAVPGSDPAGSQGAVREVQGRERPCS
ncbi:MAG: sigma-70 factor domain-containing protein, partial [Candidatus Limnocylindrales bacterium]